MIIPIRCMNCGNPIANLGRYYEARVKEVKAESGNTNTGPIYMDGTTPVTTPEGQVLDELNLTRYCCRKHFLTHTDLNQRVR